MWKHIRNIFENLAFFIQCPKTPCLILSSVVASFPRQYHSLDSNKNVHLHFLPSMFCFFFCSWARDRRSSDWGSGAIDDRVSGYVISCRPFIFLNVEIPTIQKYRHCSPHSECSLRMHPFRFHWHVSQTTCGSLALSWSPIFMPKYNS